MPDNPTATGTSETELRWLKTLVSSGSISFLFGAGVNGSSFENFRSGFQATKDKLIGLGKPGKSIEDEFSELSESDLVQYQAVLGTFISEFNGINSPALNEPSLLNIKALLTAIYRIADTTENRRPETKKINIFTVNYDCIIEEILDECGFFYHSIVPNKPEPQVPYDVIGYNTTRKTYVPTFAVYKLHGSANRKGAIDKDSIIVPNTNKLGTVLASYFESLFTMKSELLKPNAVLFILGYSGADIHVNGVINAASSTTLTVCHLPYSPLTPEAYGAEFENALFEPVNIARDLYQDTTKTLADLLAKASELKDEKEQ